LQAWASSTWPRFFFAILELELRTWTS
jgi:hypothetical protein